MSLGGIFTEREERKRKGERKEEEWSRKEGRKEERSRRTNGGNNFREKEKKVNVPMSERGVAVEEKRGRHLNGRRRGERAAAGRGRRGVARCPQRRWSAQGPHVREAAMAEARAEATSQQSGQGQPARRGLQDQLLDALLDDDMAEFRRLLAHPAVNPNFKYGKPHFSTCLEIACRHRGRHEFVRELLTKVKPNLNRIVPEPIHYAAGRGNDETLALLLRDKRTKVNAQDSAGRTALHFAAKNFGAGDDAEHYERCVALLLAHPDVDANRPNHRGFTPLHEAALSAGKRAVQAFLRHARQDLDLDSARGHGRSTRQAILAKCPELREALPERPREALAGAGRRDPQSLLAVRLQERDLDDFRRLLLEVDTEGSVLADPNHWYGKPANATCLELACKEEGCGAFVAALLQAGADPNVVNPITERSPIHVAIEKANLEALRALLAEKRTNVSATDARGRTALHYVASKNEASGPDLECLSLLLSNSGSNINIIDNDGLTPILSAVLSGNKQCVETMLQLKSESLDLRNVKMDDDKTVWNIIADRYPDLEHLLPNYSHYVHIQQPSVRSLLIEHLHKRQIKKFIQKIIENNTGNEDRHVDGDDGSYTFLQYACKHGLSEVVEVLLKCGADPNLTCETNRWPPIVIACNKRHHDILIMFLHLPAKRKLKIDATDMKGNTALHYAAKHGDLNSVLALLSHGAPIHVKNVFDKPPLPAKAVENLLNQCLKADGTHYPEEDEYKVLFDYEILVPNKIQYPLLQDEQNEDIPLGNMEGDECEVKIGNMQEHAMCSLNAEMDFLFYLSKSDEHRHILKHPIITSFLHLKWHRVRMFYYVNLIYYILFVLFLNAFVLVEIGNGGNGTVTNHDNNIDQDIIINLSTFSKKYISTLSLCLAIISTVLLTFLLLRELVQLTMSPKQYIRNAENILDWCLIVFTCLTLFVNISEVNWRKSVTVITILLSWAELVLVSGRLPKLSRNIQMLKTVSWTFLRFLVWYSLLIISFGISFYTMFHDETPGQEKNSFKGFWGSLFKTFIMMTGEFNSDDKIPFKSTNVTGYILFILFVFLIAIVLLNLLTGLAVSDTQAIRNDAHLLSLISRIRLVYEIETMLLGWYHKMTLLGIFRPLTFKFEKWIRAISLFPPSMPVKHICVLPNKGTDIMTPDEKGVKCKMDLDTLGAAMNIIGSRNKASDTEIIKSRLDIIEKCQLTNKQILDIILGKLEKLQVK